MHTRWQRCPCFLHWISYLDHAWEHQSVPCSKQRLTGKVPHWLQQGKLLSPDCQRKRWPYSSLKEGEEAERSPGLQANWEWSSEWRQKLTDLLTLRVYLAYWGWAVFILSTLHHPKYPSHRRRERQLTGDSSAPNVCTHEPREASISKIPRSAPGWGYYKPNFHPLLLI